MRALPAFLTSRSRLLRVVALVATAGSVLAATAVGSGSARAGQIVVTQKASMVAASGLGSPFASGSGTCLAGSSDTFNAVVSGNHPNPMVRLVASGPAGYWGDAETTFWMRIPASAGIGLG